MLDFLLSPYLLLFARLTVGGVLLAGAIGKLFDPDGSRDSLAAASFLPAALARPAAVALPWVEALAGGLLVLGLLLGPAALLACALLVVFSATVAVDLAQNRRKPCHCFGRLSSEPLGRMTLARNLFLLLLAVLLAARPLPYVALDGALGGSSATTLPGAVDAIPVALLALLTVLLIVFGANMIATIRTYLRAF